MIYPFRSILYNCKQATLLSIKKEEGKISLLESAKLRYHLLMCDPCRRFIQQWEVLKSKKNVEAKFTLTDESRKRIAEKIQSSL